MVAPMVGCIGAMAAVMPVSILLMLSAMSGFFREL